MRSVIRRGLELGLQDCAVRVRSTGEPDRSCNEALHQISLGWPDVRFVDIQPGVLDLSGQLDQLSMLVAIKPQDWPMTKIRQRQRAQFHLPLVLNQSTNRLNLFQRHKRHGTLHGQAYPPWSLIGRQPELYFRTGRCITPMAGQDETLL